MRKDPRLIWVPHDLLMRILHTGARSSYILETRDVELANKLHNLLMRLACIVDPPKRSLVRPRVRRVLGDHEYSLTCKGCGEQFTSFRPYSRKCAKCDKRRAKSREAA